MGNANDVCMGWGRMNKSLARVGQGWPRKLSFIGMGAIASILVSEIQAEPVFAQESELQDFHEGRTYTFSSKGHQKAAGLNLSLKIPKGWTSREGDRPHALGNFLRPDGHSFCNLIVIDTGQQISRAENMATFTVKGLRDVVPEGVNVVETQVTTLDGLPAGRIIGAYSQNRAMIEVNVLMAIYVTNYARWSITLNCGLGGLDGQAPALDELNSYLPVFNQIANSLVIHNQWEVPRVRRRQ